MSEETTQTEPTQAAETAEAQQEPEQKPDGTPEWVTKRMGELAAARRAAEQRAEQMRLDNERMVAELAQLRTGEQQQPQTQNVEALARVYAEQMVNQQRQQETLVHRLQEIESAGKKEFGDGFDKAISTLQMAGVGGDDFLRVVINVPNAEKLITWLGQADNVGEAIRLASLDPVQMGIEMTKLSSKAAKDLAKQVSKAPPPVGEIAGGSGSGGDGPEPDAKKDPKAWIAWRNKNARRK